MTMIPGAWEPRRQSVAIAELLTSVPALRPFDQLRVVPSPVEGRQAHDERRVAGPQLDAQRLEPTSRSTLIFAATLIIAAAIVYLLVIR